ncbi:MAG: hypothetical protein KDC12_01590 [Flavobacteriales bacterium]|nr:hypothetical protein [Flavobacteriales bacterium]
MNIYKFRVIIDTEADIFRDIEIDTQSNFADLHEAILRAFDWEEGEMASFYMSNETWDRGEEIPLLDMGEMEGKSSPSMFNTLLKDRVTRPDEKLVYVYDFLRMWCFYIELQEIKKAAPSTLYPRVALAYGDAPDIDEKEIDFSGGFDLMDLEGLSGGSKADSRPDKTGDPEIDAYLDDMDEEEEERFEDLDDWSDDY